jgi:hypothetical protein
MSGDEIAAAARRRLHDAVTAAAAALGALGPEPRMVAAAPHKFNDAHYDDYWCAVQIGGHYWEQSQFFATERGYTNAQARESSHMHWDRQAEADGLGGSQLASDRIPAGRRILKGLEQADWRALAEAGLRLDVILAVVVQHGETWLWIGNPQNDGAIYLVHDGGFALFAEEDDRMDDRVGDPDLILPETFHQDSFRFLAAPARRRFAPRTVDGAAAQAMGEQVLAAAGDVRAVTRRPVLLRIGRSRAFRHDYASGEELDWNDPSVTVGGVRYTSQIFHRTVTHVRDEQLRARNAERFAFVNFPGLLEIASWLTAADWRASFEAATGIDTFDRQHLHLLVTRERPLVVYRTTLLAISGDGRLGHAGYLRCPIWRTDAEEDLADIARLDERLVDAVREAGGLP